MAFRLSNDLLQAVASTVCTGCDIVQALDGLLEYVQQHEHNDDLEVQQLGAQLSNSQKPPLTSLDIPLNIYVIEV